MFMLVIMLWYYITWYFFCNLKILKLINNANKTAFRKKSKGFDPRA